MFPRSVIFWQVFAPAEAGDGDGQVGRGPCDQGPAFGRAGAGRVPEDAVGTDRPHAARLEEWEQHGEGPGVAGPGGVEPHPRRVDGQHDRGLGPSGVQVPVPRGGPTGDRMPLVGQPGEGPPHRLCVATVGGGQDDVGEVVGGRPAELDEQCLGGVLSDGEGSGETVVLAARAEGHRRCDHEERIGGCGRVDHGDRDVGVGGDRQVGPVLLGGADRDHEDRPGRGQGGRLGPGGIGESVHRAPSFEGRSVPSR